MSAPETHLYQSNNQKLRNPIASRLEDFRAKSVVRDALRYYGTSFKSDLQNGTAFTIETRSIASKLAATAFAITYIAYDTLAQYRMLYRKLTPPYMPKPDTYSTETMGFTYGSEPGYVRLPFTFQKLSRDDSVSPERATRALIQLLKHMKPHRFESLVYSEPVAVSQGYTSHPIRPETEYRMPVTDRMSLRIRVSTLKDMTPGESIPLTLPDAIYSFGLVLTDDDHMIRDETEYPYIKKHLAGSLSPSALLRRIQKSDPHLTSTEHKFHIDIPPEIRAHAVDAVMDDFFGPHETPEDRMSFWRAQFSSVLYALFTVRSESDPTREHLRLAVQLTESGNPKTNRNRQRSIKRMSKRYDLEAQLATDAFLTPPNPK